MKNIGIIGSGSFGCALATVLIKNHNVKIWSFKKEEADVINNEHRCMFIDNSKLDERIVCYTNIPPRHPGPFSQLSDHFRCVHNHPPRTAFSLL